MAWVEARTSAYIIASTKTRRWDWRVLVTVCSFAMFVLWFVLDPGGLGEWVAD
jgi:hypothetical protein